MFVQVIIGEVDDPGAMRSRIDAWSRELAPGAGGYGGLTAGAATQGSFCTVVRFDSEQAARANSERPEQGEWWTTTERLYRGPVTFVDSGDVTVVHGGPSDAAGFVQVMRARCSDRARLEKIEDEIGEAFAEWRPDLLGATRLWEPDGTVTAVDYFTSVADARAGEATEPPAVVAERFGEWQSLLSDVSWFDLEDPLHR